MTRTEAIYCLKTFIGQANCRGCRYHGTDSPCMAREAHKMAIKALEQQDILFKTNLLKDCESCKMHAAMQ